MSKKKNNKNELYESRCVNRRPDNVMSHFFKKYGIKHVSDVNESDTIQVQLLSDLYTFKIENKDETILDLKKVIKLLPNLFNPWIAQIQIYVIDNENILNDDIKLSSLKDLRIGCLIREKDFDSPDVIKVLNKIYLYQQNGLPQQVSIRLDTTNMEEIDILDGILKEKGNNGLPLIRFIYIYMFPNQAIKQLSDVLETNTSVTSLNLHYSNDPFSQNNISSLATLLTVNTTLTELSLSMNRLSDREIILLSDSLQSNTTLRTLNLSQNEIGDEGVNALSICLKVNTSISILDLSENRIGNRGAILLSEALELNRSLTILILDYNQIEDQGGDALAKMLTINTSLEKLFIEGNSLSDNSAIAFADALRVNTALIDINLASNQISDKGAIAFANMLYTNHTLKDFDLRENMIKNEGMSSLEEASIHRFLSQSW